MSKPLAGCCQLAHVCRVSQLHGAILLVQGRQRRHQVKNGNPASPMTVNGSFPAQRHKLLERLVSGRSNIESAALARFADDLVQHIPHFEGLAVIRAQVGDNGFAPKLSRRIIAPIRLCWRG